MAMAVKNFNRNLVEVMSTDCQAFQYLIMRAF